MYRYLHVLLEICMSCYCGMTDTRTSLTLDIGNWGMVSIFHLYDHDQASQTVHILLKAFQSVSRFSDAVEIEDRDTF